MAVRLDQTGDQHGAVDLDLGVRISGPGWSVPADPAVLDTQIGMEELTGVDFENASTTNDEVGGPTAPSRVHEPFACLRRHS